MLSSRSHEPDSPVNNSPTSSLSANVLITLALAVFAVCLFAIPVRAQGTCGGFQTGTSLSCGTVSLGAITTCSNGSGWYYYNNNFAVVPMSCQAATVSSCQGAADNWGVTIGYLNPVGVVYGVTTPKGLIVLHGGDGGTSPASYALTDAYFRAGSEVVQIAWSDDWELTADPFTTGTFGNIQNAACRPATVFNWIFTTLFPSVQNANKIAPICALGDSAGSAAVAYSMAYYGASNWFDNVELLSGPVLSDVEQGCQVPGAPYVNVCGANNQVGCMLGGGTPWSLSPTYLAGANSAVQKWTNDPTCANTLPINTGTPSQVRWLAQSIVDQAPGGSSGATPIFYYPKTGMSAWLCRTVKNNTTYDCAANNNANPNVCPNNSSPQGQLFYENIGTASSPPPPHYAIYAVDGCANAEGVGAGNVPGFYPAVFNGMVQGVTAITDDMIGSSSVIPAQCVKRH